MFLAHCSLRYLLDSLPIMKHTHHSLGVCATNGELQQGRCTTHSKRLVEEKQWPVGSMVEVTLMEGPFGKDV